MRATTVAGPPAPRRFVLGVDRNQLLALFRREQRTDPQKFLQPEFLKRQLGGTDSFRLSHDRSLVRRVEREEAPLLLVKGAQRAAKLGLRAFAFRGDLRDGYPRFLVDAQTFGVAFEDPVYRRSSGAAAGRPTAASVSWFREGAAPGE